MEPLIYRKDGVCWLLQIQTTLSESYGFPSSLCCLLVHRAGVGMGIGVEDIKRSEFFLESSFCIRILHQVDGLDRKIDR